MIRNVVNLINPYDAGDFPEDISKRYKIPEADVIQLGSNENPYPPSEQVKEAYYDSLKKINRYPHPSYYELKNTLSDYLVIDSELITVGNGAGDILRYICDITVDTMDKVAIPVPSYTLYAIFAMMRDASISFIDFPGYEIKASEIPDSQLIFLCSPNNPVGTTIPRKEIIKILKNCSGYVIIDEAYSEFSGETNLDLVNKYDNLIIVRSFSKFFGLAGMRIGYAVGSSDIISAIEKTRPPFCISNVSQSVAIAAINSKDYYTGIKDKIISERERMVREIKTTDFAELYPSKANFILIKLKDGFDLRSFEKEGIIIRNVTGLMGLHGNHIRITIGEEDENNKIIEMLKQFNSI